MKLTKTLIWSLVLMTIVAAVYRVIPGRPLGFAPQLALTLFGGAIIKDKKWAFVIPIMSMLLSDLLYQGLFVAGLTSTPGFYGGQWINYLLIATVTVFGFMINKLSVGRILAASLLAPTYYFLVSNFLTWVGVGDYVEYPKTGAGLMLCYEAGLPFYYGSLAATVFFSGVLFGSWYFINKRSYKTAAA